MLESLSVDQVKKHNRADDCWIIVDNVVFDVTKFAKFHPGGEALLQSYGGNDATEDFFALHRSEIFVKYKERLAVGVLDSKQSSAIRSYDDVSKIPYAEAGFWRGLRSPFYTERHFQFRKWMRKFLNDNIRETAERCETTEQPIPDSIYELLGREGIFAAWLGPKPGEHLKMVDKLPMDLKVEEFDYFHELIIHQEFARMLTPGFVDGLVGGRNISLPTLLYFGTEKMKREVVPQVLRGKKHSALAITEPYAGSDVANIRTTATLSADGSHFLVNGVKKWITEGYDADYYVTAVRTNDKRAGRGGIMSLLIEKSEGITTTILKTVYSSSAKTSLVIFDNVKVPVENVISFQGFQVIMHGFNHERWMIAAKQIARGRLMIEECWRWATVRKVFNKPLISQPVVMENLSKMISRIESCEALLENITYQMCNMPFEEQNEKLGGPIALLKYDASDLGHVVAAASVSIFGGRGMTKDPTSQGRYVERYQRTYRLFGVYGGASEIMASLGVKQAQRRMDQTELARL